MEKRKINSKAKGDRAELELAKILTERFGLPFARVGVSSGARVKNTRLPENAIGVMASDIIVPPGFRFSIEVKAVNKSVDLLEQSALLDKFLAQADADAKRVGKMPMLCWKRNRKGWIAVVPSQAFRLTFVGLPMYCSQYRDWMVINLEALLAMKNPSFWFTLATEDSP
jgi:hypothetical protein